MDEIRAPAQAILRQPRKIYIDQEQQPQILPFRHHGQPRRREWEQREYPDPMWGARLLAIFKLEMPKPNYSHPLPLFNTQPTQYSLSMENIALNTLGPTLQNVRVRRRNTPAYQMIQGTGAMNQRAEAAGRDSGVTAKNRRLNILDPRKASHERRKRELLEILEPVLGSDDSDSSSIFLCWGKDNRCHIVPVKIPNSADDVTVWQEIRRVWYAHRGGWRKRLNLFGVREVGIVEISIAGRELKCKQQTKHKRFVGTYTTEDLAAEKGRLEQIIASYDPQEFPCPYNPSTGQVNCFSSCISYKLDGIICPERTLYQA
ncbi:uncharacterized protein K444DRAFT_709177 [Hyaloscypha bicolor E]|uniref:Uncharacterized protein n=1 Tax=Hyaloscypha bicolor E TaxID=1095630 RepID=A0A2J6SN32_9HELO|nr:uncharacterized protein K444DRAFT_709177 [Hyaloscypha bicolor E]PMD52179.1 hypothetical protein K444DRAFT_709177 [Hyaloscypha bicolor E]